jgi:hypothetical protein
MNYYLIRFVIPSIGALFALWISLSISNNNFFEIVIASILLSLVAGIASALHNAKLIRSVLGLLVIGYFIAGKGFAYIGIHPFYIGEIVLAWCVFCWLLRLSLRKIDKPFPDGLVFYVLSAIVISGTIQLFFVIETYGFLAMRDYAMIGYIGYFIISYDVFKLEKNRKTFYRMAIAASIIAMIMLIISTVLSLDWTKTVPLSLSGRPIFMPHSDTLVPVYATLTSFLVSGAASSGLSMLGISCAIGLVLFSLANLKSAFLLGLIAVMGLYLFVKKLRSKLIQVSMGVLVSLSLAIIVILAIGGTYSKELEDRVGSEFKSLLPNEIFTSGNVRTGSTAEWRYIWWSKIAENTLNRNPLFGSGLGSDISKDFLKDYFSFAVVEDDGSISRYPHNILFTALGRLGLVGFTLWGALILTIFLYAFNFARAMKIEKRPAWGFYAWSFVLAAVANSLVQATFEAPYAAIPFWIFFGCAIREYEEILKKIIDIKHSK